MQCSVECSTDIDPQVGLHCEQPGQQQLHLQGESVQLGDQPRTEALDRPGEASSRAPPRHLLDRGDEEVVLAGVALGLEGKPAGEPRSWRVRKDWNPLRPHML